MKLIAQKPCSFGGKRFYIGDEVPAELVIDPNAQKTMGVLAVVDETAGAAVPAVEKRIESVSTMELIVRAEEGDMPLTVTKDGLQSIFDVLTGKTSDAEEIINKMTDGDALILLHISDSRKAVKAAAEARARAISSESEGEQ